MQNKYDNITIALAGIVQAICLVKELAQTGKINEDAFQISIQSILATHPENTVLVFGDLTHLQLGLEQLAQLFLPKSANSRTMIRQILSIIRLQRKISRSPKAIEMLTQRVQQAKKQAEYFSITHTNILANLGDTYLTLINMFHFRFFIMGNQRFLSIRENIDKIRTLLLAAIRAAVLWRQSGGSRLQLIFSSKQIKASIEKILTQLKDQQRNSYVSS
ncbi:MAG: high frequency lysogenization protein HflD [Gammaproteobacteria bacterium]|nr:high frequency lysogenization protein HflD [Gammaproteobacteria bacterium]